MLDSPRLLGYRVKKPVVTFGGGDHPALAAACKGEADQAEQAALDDEGQSSI